MTPKQEELKKKRREGDARLAANAIGFLGVPAGLNTVSADYKMQKMKYTDSVVFSKGTKMLFPNYGGSDIVKPSIVKAMKKGMKVGGLVGVGAAAGLVGLKRYGEHERDNHKRKK